MLKDHRFAPYSIYWQSNPELWQYFIFNSEIFGCDWRKQDGEEDVYRMVIVRKAKQPGLQGFFYTFPEANEYDTKDLFKLHPTAEDHWMHYGRADSIIVFSNGEKLNPVTIEDIVMKDPMIRAALTVGSNRFQPGLLLEPCIPVKDEEEARELTASVWPLVVQANEQTVAHGQIGRQFIAVSKPSKPFLRTSKDTLQRAATLKL